MALSPRHYGWQTVALNACIETTAPICYGILMPGVDTPGGVPVVKVRDYDGKVLRSDGLLRAAPAIEAPYRRSRLKGGDLLLTIRGTTGTVALVPDALEGANITQDSARIRVRRDLSTSFLHHALTSGAVQRQIRLHTIGQAVKGINIGEVRKLQLLLPPRAEQDYIAHLLDEWDHAVGLEERVLKLKRRLKRGLMQQLLTGRRRFPEFAGQPWRECHIRDIAQEVTGRAGDPDLPVLSCTKHHGLVDSLAYFGRQVYGKDRGSYKVVRRGEFAYATNHIEEGSIGLLKHREAGLVSPMYTVFAVTAGVDADYLFAVLKTETYRHEFARRTSGSVNRRGGLRWDDFAQIRLKLPPLAEQRRIVAVLQIADREIDLLEQQLAALREQKKGLMQKLLTGQVRLRIRRSESTHERP